MDFLSSSHPCYCNRMKPGSFRDLPELNFYSAYQLGDELGLMAVAPTHDFFLWLGLIQA